MQKRFRNLLAAVLAFVMVAGIVLVFDLKINANAADVQATEVVYDYIYDISQYRDEGRTEFKAQNFDKVQSMASYKLIASVYNEYPAKEGYVFAGWYTDVKQMLPLGLDVTTGGAYAKFVPESLIKSVAQVSVLTDYTTASSALRFIVAVDNLDYNQIGFKMTKKGTGSYFHTSSKVHDSLSAALEGCDSLTPDYFGEAAHYMAALTLTGIKDQDNEYTAMPFWVTDDGTLVDHVETAEKTVEMGVDRNVAAGLTTVEANTAWFKNSQDEFTISTEEELIGFAELSKSYNFKGKTIKLGADITFNDATLATLSWFVHDSASNTWSVKDGVEIWPGVGSAEVPFAGTFDGQGHTVQGLAMLATGKLGMFVQTNGATVKNVNVEKSSFRNLSASDSTLHCTGALIAFATNTTVSNVYSDAYLAYGNTLGGIIGHAVGTVNVSNSWFDGTLNGAWGNIRAGGIVGFGNSAATTLNITNCLFTGTGAATFNTGANVGGIVGFGNWSNKINITNCLSAGNLNAAAFKGTGNGSVIGNTPGGGGGKYTNVYATNECYKNSEGTSVAIGAGTSYTGTPTLVAKADIAGDAAKTGAVELDYDTVWMTVSESTPVLRFVDPLKMVDTSWYDANKTEYVLYDAADLNGFVLLSKTNTFSGKTVKLGADITYNTGDAADWATTPPANVWTPIGDTASGFVGTFDGQGRTVSGLYCKNDGYATFVARMYAGGKMKNVRIVNSYFESSGTGDSFHNGAGIVGRVTGGAPVSGVYTDAIFKGVKGVGIIAFSDSGGITMTNCWFDGTIDVTGATNVGGMVSNVANNQNHNFTNCLFTGTMTGTGGSGAYIGGMVGIGPYGTKTNMTNCLVAGDMTAVTTGTVGSVIGNNPGGNKSVYTNVYATNETHANLKGAGGATFPVTAVAEADILGSAAKTTLSGFDFVLNWSIRENDVPQLGVNGADFSWYDASATEYVLYDAADLYGFSYLQETTNFSGKIIKLGADIVLNEGNAADWATAAPANVWEPIGKDDASLGFEGTFDGQGHTISGLYYDSASYGGGLFVYTGSNAVIKNLKLTNSYIRSTYNNSWSATGTVAAFVNGTDFFDVYSDAIIDTTSGYTGGIGGRLQGNGSMFENCEFAGTITGTGTNASYIGGILGGHNTNAAGASSYIDCVFSGNITGNQYVGGLAGRSSGAAGSTTTVTGAKITGTVNAYNTSASYAGGLFGLAEVSTLSVKDSSASGTINGTVGIVGGYIGIVSTANVTIQDSTFSGAVNGGTKLGGFVGQVNTAANTTTVKNSTFDGTVTATNATESRAAGIVGYAAAGSVTVMDTIVSGTIVTPSPYAAGVISSVAAANTGTITLDGCIVTADIQCASSNAGGLIGRLHNAGKFTVVVQNNLAMATFTTDSWCTAQIIAHADSNKVTMANNFFVQTANAAANGVESGGSNITAAPVKLSNERVIAVIESLFYAGMRPDYNGFMASLSDTTYTISDAADLYGFAIASLSNNFAGKTVKLEQDITVNDEGSAYNWDQTAPKYRWFPIASVEKSFAGTFDGNRKTISGIYCEYAAGNGMGLFTSVSGTIQDFRLENSYFENTVSANYGYNASITAHLNGGTVARVYSDAVMKTVDSWAGGIVGMVAGEATITECQFDGSLMARCNLHGGCTQSIDGGAMNLFEGTARSGRSHAAFIGGIAGCLKGTSVDINNCLYTGKIYNECMNAHRTGGIMGGINEGAATITKCISAGNFVTLNNTGNNSYHFNMIMDCRGLGGMPTNAETLFEDNYILNTKLYDATGKLINKGTDEVNGDYLAGASSWNIPILDEEGNPVLDDEGEPVYKAAVRYTPETLGKKLEAYYASHTGNLDFDTVWLFNNQWKTAEDKMPSLRLGDTSRKDSYIYHGVDGDESLFLPMDGATKDTFNDKNLVATPIEDPENAGEQLTNKNGYPLYTVEYEESATEFENIDYSDGGYITKYTGTTLENYESYIQTLVDFGFTKGESNIVNTDDAYYTALTFGNNAYSITYFANSGETYVTASGKMKHSPYMNAEYFKTAVNTEGGEPIEQHEDVTITTLELSNGGLCQIIRLKNGHYIVIDGGTGIAAVGATVRNQDTNEDYTIKSDAECETNDVLEYNRKIKASRAELAAALGATVRPVYDVDEETGETVVVDYEDPAVVVDAWIFTHDHNDHAGWLSGGVFGAMQVDVYIKGFYYNFSNAFRENAEIVVGEMEDEEGNLVDKIVDGYVSVNYKPDSTVDSVDRYHQLDPSDEAFWVEYSASNKTAANVNKPSWGKRGIPIYRVQAGQKFYFDGVTVEVPYTQDQVQPAEYVVDSSGETLALNNASAWFLFTDDNGHTFLEAGDAEIHNQDAVIELYDDYYDGGEGPNYALFGADVVNAFHHGLNLAVDQTVEDGVVTATDYARLNTIFGVEDPEAADGTDGRTQFIFYTRGYLNNLFGYVSDHTSTKSKNMQANHYLTGYVYPELIESSFEAAKAFENLTSPIKFASSCTRADEKGVSWQGTTTVTFSESGVTWDKHEQNIPTETTPPAEESTT